MKSKFYKFISILVFPFQHSRVIKFFLRYEPFENDAEILYFSIYGERCSIYCLENRRFINKSLLDELKEKYPKFEMLSSVRNTAYQSDLTIVDHQRMQFLIILKKKLFVEFDTMTKYRIYYHERNEEDLKRVLGIFRRHQKTSWLRYYNGINFN